MHGGHKSLNDSPSVVQDFRHWGQAVRGARRVGNDLQVLVVGLLVHAHHEHRGVVLRGGTDDYLFSTSLDVFHALCFVGEFSSGFADEVSSGFAPFNCSGILLFENFNFLSVDN